MAALPEFYSPQAERLALALNIDAKGKTGEKLLAEVIKFIARLQRKIGCAEDFSSYDIPLDDVESVVAAIASDPASIFFPIPSNTIEEIVICANGRL